MPQDPEKPIHPGSFVREHVIPTGMSVTEAAKRLGVGRPALSKLLNARSSLSQDMAVKLRKTFGADPEKLLALQAASDRSVGRSKEMSTPAHVYVPPFLTIKADQIGGWAKGNIAARQLLPVLLRRLIRSTGEALRQVDFPGYDNAERKGWDGLVDAGAATPWISEGKSGWELGTGANPGDKANSDYRSRTGSVSSDERREHTFIFVTTRNWPGKKAWEEAKDASGKWRAVRAFDASDLEQWLEESIPAQIWLAEQLGIPVRGFETLDRFWQRWADASDPSIVPAMFEPSVQSYCETFKEWLEKERERPFVVTAESKEEAIAFLACMFQDSAIAPQWRDLPVVFESDDELRKLASCSAPFVPIASTDKAAHALADVHRRLHCIVVSPHNVVDSTPDIRVDLLRPHAFVQALKSMGVPQDESERLARESGCSPTILRRRLSKIDAIRSPEWAKDSRTARDLIPMALIGTWHAESEADCEVVRVLAARPYREVEESVARMRQDNDSPVWSVGEHRGVVSRVDALFAINRHVTPNDLTEFLWLAEYVLSEIDPALDLPEESRWAAGLYGKVRNHSSALRDGLLESLVILSIHGNDLFRDRIGTVVDVMVGQCIEKLLTPLTLEKLLSHCDDLPRYAEAAPEVFLKLIEEDLQQSDPVTLRLLEPVDNSNFFSRLPRSGLLWSMECLAWKYVARVSAILARLSRTVIDDKWENKPIASLKSIYRSWVPQTAASLKDRMKALEMLTRRFPDIGWQICVEQLERAPRSGDYSYRPRWRSDASGVGRPVPRPEAREFERQALKLALLWSEHDQRTLGDLVTRIQVMSEEEQLALWDRIDAWLASKPSDTAKADLRERIRQVAFTRLGQGRGFHTATKDRARRAYTNLQPKDTVIRHAWLFADSWVEFTDDIEDEDASYLTRVEKSRLLRTAAIEEIWMDRGFEGVRTLLSHGSTAEIVGDSLRLIICLSEQADFLRRCLSVTGDFEAQFDRCIGGLLRSISADDRHALLLEAADDANVERTARLFRCAPFGQKIWRLMDRYGEKVRARYWDTVFPEVGRYSEAESTELIDRLLEARRPRAVFHAVWFDWSSIETSRLKRLLLSLTSVGAISEEGYRLDPHDVSEALDSLDGRPGVSRDDMAQLEFLFITELGYANRGIPNLERKVAESPAEFFRALAFACDRRHRGEDPRELRIDDPAQREAMALSCLDLLDRVSIIPGTSQDGGIDVEVLSTWVMEVRRLCAEHDRTELGDQHIGQLLSKARPDDDGMWPCRAICEVMEAVASEHIGKGFWMGVYNSRGVYWGRREAEQERVSAQRYRDLAEQRNADYPYVSSVLNSIGDTYDREAKQLQIEAEIEKRRSV